MKFSFVSFAGPLAALLAVAPTPRLRAAETLPFDALVTEIVAKNPELQFYQAEIDAAKAGRRSAGTLANPELSVEAGRKRVHDALGTLAGEGTAWSVSVAQTFEWPGRLALRKSIANRQIELAELGLARFQTALAGRTATLAYTLSAAREKAAVVREVAERFRALKETFLARDPAAITPVLETRVIEAQELAIQRRATEAELAAAAAQLELNQLRGVPAQEPIALAGVRLTFRESPAREALLAAAREKHFEFRAKKIELEQQGFVVQLARHERYPSFEVRPYYSVENAGERERQVGVGVSVPLSVGARGRSGVDVAEARRRQAETAVLVAQREMERDVGVAAQIFAAKRAEMNRWAPDTVDKFREAAALADRHYRLGAVPLATYVELQTAYLEAAEALLDTKREALEAGLRVQLLTGVDLKLVELVP